MYKITCKIGSNSFLAQKDGAMYVLKPCLPEEKQVYDILLTFRHPNAARYTGYADIDGALFAVSEFVSGMSVADYIKMNGTMPDDMIKHITKGVCGALSGLHALGIVHRDIKPENIIINTKGDAVVIDFGISRIFDSSKSKDTQVLGTVGYAAPEQFGFRQTSPKADIYALGALINFMAEGELPADSLTQGKYKRIVVRCTQIDDRKRYRSAKEVSAAFDKKFLFTRLASSVPGYSGGAVKAVLATIYYGYILESGLMFVLAGQIVVFFCYLLFMISLPFIITDSVGIIREFTDRKKLGRSVEYVIKAVLCITLFSLLLFISIVFSIY